MYTYEKGTTGQSLLIWIADSTQFDGRGKTGLTPSDVTIRYRRGGVGADSGALTLGTLTAMTATFTSNGFMEVDSTNWPGWYRWDAPNALYGSPGDSVADVFVMLKGTGTGSGTGAAHTPIKITLTEPVYVANGAFDSNVKYVNDGEVGGSGGTGDEWGPA